MKVEKIGDEILFCSYSHYSFNYVYILQTYIIHEEKVYSVYNYWHVLSAWKDDPTYQQQLLTIHYPLTTRFLSQQKNNNLFSFF